MQYMNENFLLRSNFLLIAFMVFVCGCKEVNTTNHPSLSESEIFFDGELLSSISQDVFNESLFFIGTEDGVVYEYHSDLKQLGRRFESGADRIYKVVRSEEEGDTIYWLGTRNQGLWRCGLRADSLVKMDVHGRYFIPTKDKATEYSAYDISVQPNGVYVGTSHGLLKVPADSATSDTLKIIAPASFKSNPKQLSPVVAGNILILDSNTMFCASDSGLWKIDLQTAKVDTKLPKRKIWNITERDDTIYALTEQQLHIVDKQGTSTDSIVLDSPSQIYYYEKCEKVNYFLSDNQIQIVQDCNIHKKDPYHTVNLRRPVRTKCHNVIVNDTLHRQSLMITDHAILRLAHHQDVLNPMNAVAHATTDDGFIYYQIDHRLFQQAAGDTIAHHIKNFPKDMSVRFMEVLNGKLYYVSADNRIFRFDLHSNYFLKTLSFIFGDEQVGSLDKRREVTAIGKNDTTVYVGVRDGFRCVVSNPDKDIQLLSVSGDTIPTPFVTAFAQTNGRDAIFGTLNDGIFVGHDTTFLRKSDSNTIKFIRDIALKPDGAGYYVLNNRNLYSLSTEGELIDCKPATGFRKLLIPDTCHIYGISSYGLRDFKDSTEYFQDLIFNPQASVVCDRILYASSSSGVYMLSPSFAKKGNVENGYMAVQFKSRIWLTYTFMIHLLIFLSLSLALSLYFLYYFSQRYLNLKKGLHELKAQKKSLEKLLKAEDMKNLIKKEEVKALIKESGDADETKDVTQILEQIKKNNCFFSNLRKLELFSIMFDYWAMTSSYAIKIDGLNFKEIIISESMAVTEKIEEINKLMRQIEKEKIAQYIANKINEAQKANQLSAFDYFPVIQAYETLMQQCNTTIDISNILTGTFYTNLRLFMLNRLDEIQEVFSRYRDKDDATKIEENEVDKTRIKNARKSFSECLAKSPEGNSLDKIGIHEDDQKWQWIAFEIIPAAKKFSKLHKLLKGEESSLSRARGDLRECIRQNISVLEQEVADTPSSIIRLIIEIKDN